MGGGFGVGCRGVRVGEQQSESINGAAKQVEKKKSKATINQGVPIAMNMTGSGAMGQKLSPCSIREQQTISYMIL